MALFTGTQQSYYQGSDNAFNTADDLSTYGNYQYVNLKDLVNNFIVAYVGEGKIINKVKRPDVNFHAQRAIAELKDITGLQARDMHDKNVMIRPQTGDIVIMDVGLFTK